MSQRNESRNLFLKIAGLGLVMVATLAPTASANSDILGLRLATAPFHSIDVARAAGWDTPLTDCWEDPQGGMGYHYGNLDLIDGEVEPFRPETVLYEPLSNGSLRLVAVEYLVPEELSPEPPVLFGRQFHSNGNGLWILHVWVWRNNPRGMFADWNPRVSCDYADD